MLSQLTWGNARIGRNLSSLRKSSKGCGMELPSGLGGGGCSALGSRGSMASTVEDGEPFSPSTLRKKVMMMEQNTRTWATCLARLRRGSLHK